MGQAKSSEQSKGKESVYPSRKETPTSPVDSLETGALVDKGGAIEAEATSTGHGCFMLRWTGSSLASLAQAESKLLVGSCLKYIVACNPFLYSFHWLIRHSWKRVFPLVTDRLLRKRTFVTVELLPLILTFENFSSGLTSIYSPIT